MTSCFRKTLLCNKNLKYKKKMQFIINLERWSYGKRKYKFESSNFKILIRNKIKFNQNKRLINLNDWKYHEIWILNQAYD